jgi:hypothetical protein
VGRSSSATPSTSDLNLSTATSNLTTTLITPGVYMAAVDNNKTNLNCASLCMPCFDVVPAGTYYYSSWVYCDNSSTDVSGTSLLYLQQVG